MAKNGNGFTPPKGKPSENKRETSGLTDAFAASDPETQNEIRSKYLTEDEKPDENVDVKHPNRNLDMGEDS